MKKFVWMAAMLICFGNAAMAQNNRPDPKVMIERRAERMAQELNVKADKKQAFIDLYKKYQEELFKGNGEMKRMEPLTDEQAKKLTEAEALQRIDAYFGQQQEQMAREQMRLMVQRNYLMDFKEMLTPEQMVKLFIPQRRNGNNQRQQGGNRGGGNFHGGNFGGFGGDPGFGGPGGF